MAANGRRPRSRYSPPGPVSGNLARKMDSRELERRLESSGQLDFDQQYRNLPYIGVVKFDETEKESAKL